MLTIQLDKQKASNYVLEAQINDLDIIQFIRNNIDNELIVHSVDEYDSKVTVKESEKSKTYALPLSIFKDRQKENTELDENVNSNEKKKSIIPNIFSKHIDWDKVLKYWIIVIIWAIIIKNFLPSNANLLTTWTDVSKIEKTQVQILTDKLNKNNIENALKKEKRKKLLDDLKNLDSKIQETDKNNSLILENINLITK